MRTLAAVAAAAVVAVAVAAPAVAQSSYPTNPYTQPPGPPTPCNVYVVTPSPSCGIVGLEKEFDFANVFIGVEGYAHTFVAPKNKTDEYNIVVIEVTVTNRLPIRYRMVLAPQQRPEPVKLNDWPELKDVHTGVSVIVRASKPLSVSATMHPDDLPTFWTAARILEGR